jgi:hypothetical protein
MHGMRFYRNLNEEIPLDYRYLNPIIALILIPIAYALQKKTRDRMDPFSFGRQCLCGAGSSMS